MTIFPPASADSGRSLKMTSVGVLEVRLAIERDALRGRGCSNGGVLRLANVAFARFAQHQLQQAHSQFIERRRSLDAQLVHRLDPVPEVTRGRRE